MLFSESKMDNGRSRVFQKEKRKSDLNVKIITDIAWMKLVVQHEPKIGVKTYQFLGPGGFLKLRTSIVREV